LLTFDLTSRILRSIRKGMIKRIPLECAVSLVGVHMEAT
jgi:hypothetical protein